MKAVRRLGFILGIFCLGILIGHTSITFSLFVITPLIISWLIFWDTKKFESNQKKTYDEYDESYYYE